ncbi:MAG: antitoxin [Alphaproteobacteria bacterium]
MNSIAKLFMNGRSQAVRLPKEFRFDSDQVRIRKEGSAVILEPILDNWDWLTDLHAIGPLDDDVIEAVNDKTQMQERNALDIFE